MLLDYGLQCALPFNGEPGSYVEWLEYQPLIRRRYLNGTTGREMVAVHKLRRDGDGQAPFAGEKLALHVLCLRFKRPAMGCILSAMTGEDILAANVAFYRAFNQKDISAMDAVWARDVDVACVHPGWNVLQGRDPIIESWARILSNPNQPRIMTGGATATVIGDVGIVVCRELVGGTPLAATNVFVREAGAWKMIHHHSGPVALPG